MKKYLKMALAFVAAIFFSFRVLDVFAANPYGMVFSGGELLGDGNVQIAPGLVNGLQPLVTNDIITGFVRSSSPLWKEGYVQIGSNCSKSSYFLVQNASNTFNNLSYDLATDKYTLNVTIKGVHLESMDGSALDGTAHAVVFPNNRLSFGGGYLIYTDNTCEEVAEPGVTNIRNVAMFVELNIKLYNADKSAIFKSDALYFGIMDIDASQSYKILNSGNQLVPQNMYARSASDLQPSSDDPTRKNMYVPGSNYIYATSGFNITESGNDVFVKAGLDMQEDGLDIVFGYRNGAATSALGYYSPEYVVKYKSDGNGEISGLTTEDVLHGNKPSGSKTTPNVGFALDHWIADKNVTLASGATIAAGNSLTSKQVKQVIVKEDLVFTAIHRDAKLDVEYQSDINGIITGITDEKVVPNDNPSGSATRPDPGFALDHWEADKDVTLTSGDTIAAGNSLTSEQVTQVVVTENLVFTAIHRDIKLDVTYESDSNGTITGITDERVIPNDNPSGSESTPERGYAFDHWEADKDVTLATGDTILAGEPLSPDQVAQVVVTENLVFTAIHRDTKLNVKYESDEYGEITGITEEKVVPNDNPSGTEDTPERGYELEYWVADKDVTLTDGIEIEAGIPINLGDVEKVVVTEDITFTAIHRDMRLNVAYESDEHGEITGITGEKVVPNDNPAGTDEAPEEGFAFDHWEADKDVTLTTGDTIAAGEPLSPEQVAQVVITENLVFTAIHRDMRLNVAYESDEGGDITGIDDEPVVPGDNPTGSEEKAKEEYEFDHWEADKDVRLEDGTEIPAGEPITPEQIPQIVVTEDITLTAIHKKVVTPEPEPEPKPEPEPEAPETPDTGIMTNGSTNGMDSESVATILGIVTVLISVAVSVITRIQKRRAIYKF